MWLTRDVIVVSVLASVVFAEGDCGGVAGRGREGHQVLWEADRNRGRGKEEEEEEEEEIRRWRGNAR